MTSRIDFVADEAAMLAYGAALAKSLADDDLVFLEGELGSGKTTLARGILRGLGFTGHVKSPTYTLVEPYEFDSILVYHFDFYRIRDPEELEYIGFDDLPARARDQTRRMAGARVRPTAATESGRQHSRTGRRQARRAKSNGDWKSWMNARFRYLIECIALTFSMSVSAATINCRLSSSRIRTTPGSSSTCPLACRFKYSRWKTHIVSWSTWTARVRGPASIFPIPR